MSGQPCNCIEAVNKQLAERNTQIHLPWMMIGGGQPRPFVETMKLDPAKRGKPVSLFASFCPFCGKAYAEAKPSCDAA